MLWLPIAVPLALKLSWRPFQASSPAQKLPLLLWLYLVAPLALGVIVSWRKTPLADYGLVFQPRLFLSLAIGLLAGSSSLAILFWGQIRAGWIQQASGKASGETSGAASGPASRDASGETSGTVAANSSAGAGLANGFTYLLLLGLALLVGGVEELVFRGFMQTQLQQTIAVGSAAAAVSLLFAALHGLWEGKTLLPQLPGLWLMGLVLTLACRVDAGLGLAWGLHAGCVWVLASLDALGFTAYSGKAPIWLTGWNDQPLAGLLGLLFLLATGTGLWVCR